MTNGYGAMPSYASRIEPDDRWRIAAYIRVLQLSQNARIEDVPPDQRGAIDQGPLTPPVLPGAAQ
jgi:mono/diheme cytochrome c family protein